MTLPVGEISLSQVNTELGISPSSTLITMNDAAVRTLAGVGGSGTVISMQNLQGKSSVFALTISSNTYNYNLATAAPGAGWPGSSAIQLTINPGVVVGSTSTGTFALQIPSALNPAPSVTVINNGTVIGMGGDGGRGARGEPPASPSTGGSPGGAALFVGRPVVITNNGTLAGGGGGGGGGGARTSTFPGALARRGGGGGGGAGFNSGAGGAGGTGPPTNGFPGSPGTVPAGGAGGAGISPFGVVDPLYRGGDGGGQGASGSSGSLAPPAPGQRAASGGGGAGAYISGLPLATFPVTGTRLGPSS
jgi:hypothetical protein